MNFPELAFLENLLERLKNHARIEQLVSVPFSSTSFPIYSISLGSKNPHAPTLAIFGGVHGQEKIGTQVVLSYLETISELLHWDETIHQLLEKSRIVFMPIVNPVGMFLTRRANGNRVDLMRNAPLDSEEAKFLLGGQRISPYLPWYRGAQNAPMELEAQALCDLVRREVMPAKVSIALDCHSGYGTVDRLWFPYSKTVQPYPDLAKAFALKNLLDNTYPNHVYHMEPCSLAYTMSGDLWDYLWDEHQGKTPENTFMPITLEMGSWLWLKKNPVQLFSDIGLFHPMHLHRHKRVLRRHITLLDFFHRAVISPKPWADLADKSQKELRHDAINYWYNEE